ncbi:MAG TPA: hypothetical protein PKK31_03380 [Elusimicrobiales bacterium]|nr:hypothetical protein [Elusimicrobiales bacterium]
MSTLALLLSLLCAPAASAGEGARADIRDIAETSRLAEQIAHLTWPFEQASSSSATRGLLDLAGLTRAELAAVRSERIPHLKPLPEFAKLDHYTYRDATLAASQNLLVFLAASPALPGEALGRAGAAARALLPLLNSEALRISVADPGSLYAKRIADMDRDLEESAGNIQETDSTLALAELMLALGEYRRRNGAPPARLEALVPEFIERIPLWATRHHQASAKVVNYGGSDKKPAKAVTDDGGWLYFSSPLSRYYGQVFPNCRHKMRDGRPAYLLGGPEHDRPQTGKAAAQ